MEMDKDQLVFVGEKPVSAYVQATLWALNNHGKAQVRGLGEKQSKVLEIKKELKEISNIEIKSTESINVGGTPGLEMTVRKGESK